MIKEAEQAGQLPHISASELAKRVGVSN
jgi:hypothetical protein